MANPLETLTKVVGFGIQQGTKVLGGAISTVTGRGGDNAPSQQEQKQRPTRAQQQRQRQRKAASQRRASQQPKPLDDVTITRKVETEIFRGSKVAKSKISVNTADGVVWLRGEAKNPEQVKDLEAKARAIPEVKRVENLLHLPKTPAPTRTDTPPTQRKTRTSKASQTSRKVTTGRTTSEKRASTAPKEPAPADLARAREGRHPAPLGTEETTGGSQPAPLGTEERTGGSQPAPLGTEERTGGSQPAPLGTEETTGGSREPAPLGTEETTGGNGGESSDS